MARKIDTVELARTLSEIASTTADPAAAIRLLELVREILAAAGLRNLPPDGGMPPQTG
ncbi:MAG: hypothetical protein ABSC95_13730 [Acetobacteraceae bacterium]|jgi:hypothetical protein